MSGLYQRALQIRETRRNLRLVRADELEEADELAGSAEEREQILQQIDTLVDESRMQLGPESFRVSPARNGAVMPILLNVVALLLLGVGGYLLLDFFDAGENTIAAEAVRITSAEGLLLQRLRAESEERLSEKDREIAAIRDRLADIRSEEEQLESEAQARLEERSAQLRAEYEEAVAAERRRLSEGSFSEDQIAARMQSFVSQQEQTLQTRLEQLDLEVQREIAARRETLRQLAEETEASLQSVVREREEIKEEYEAREAALSEELSSDGAQEPEAEAARQRLSRLEEAQRQQELVSDQLFSYYDSVRSALGDQQYGAALDSLEELRTYITDSSISELPVMQRRLRTELFLIDSLETRIEREQSRTSADSAALIESAELLERVSELVGRAERSLERGQTEAARELYRSAISQVPAIRESYDRLESLEEQRAARQATRVASFVQRGNALYGDGRYEEAAAAYENAIATLPTADDELLSRLFDTAYRLRSAESPQELEAVRSEIAGLEARLDERDERIAELETQLDAREADIDEREARISALESRLDARRTESEDTAGGGQPADLRVRLTEAVEAREAAFAERAQAQEARQNAEQELQSTRAALEEAQAARRQAVSELESRNEALTEAREARQEAEQELASLREDIAGLETQLAAREADIDEREARIAALESRLEAQQGEDSASDRQLADLRSDLSDAIQAREAAAAARAQALEGRREAEAELESANNALKEAQAARRQALTELRSSNAALEEAREEIADLRRYRTLYEEQQELAEEIRSYQARFSERLEDVPPAEDSLRLLEAKLLVVRIIGSEPVRSEYPDLTGRLDDYLDALVAEQRAAATAETLAKVNRVLDEIAARSGDASGAAGGGAGNAGGGNDGAAQELADSLSAEEAQRHARSLFERLETLADPGAPAD